MDERIEISLDANDFVTLDDPHGYAEQFFMSRVQWVKLVDEIKDGQHDLTRLVERRG